MLLGPLQGMLRYKALLTRGFLFKFLLRHRRAQIKVVDERVRVLGEIINAIRSVKVFAWERHFASMVSEMRGSEHSLLRKRALLSSTINSIFVFMPIVAITRETHLFFFHKLRSQSLISRTA